jgi:endonuclease/exonuclease/phosphatase family metal-dependent hydrolase
LKTTRNYLPLILSLILFLLISTGAAQAQQDYVTVATFNIAELGEGSHPDTRDELARAGMLVNLDLVAIQEEVGTRETGESQVQLITSYMNGLLGPGRCRYNCLTSTFDTGDERYAFIWRSPVVMTSGLKKMDDRQEYKGSLFVRTPVYCSFRAGDFDFVIMNVHLYTRAEVSAEKGRKVEYQQLVDWLKYQVQNVAEKDYLIVGDYNRYLDRSSCPNSTAWSTLTYGGFENDFKLLLHEALPGNDYGLTYAPTDEWSTTIAQRRSKYDQILISSGAYREFGTVQSELDARFGQNVGIEDFDNEPQYSQMGFCGLKYTISDHRSVWTKFSTNLGDDD